MQYKQEQITPYADGKEKTEQVEAMFDSIAPTYDTLNHRLSFGIDHAWRKQAVRWLRQYKPSSVLDVATGTGDFALLIAQRLKPQQVVGIDLSEGMMQIGAAKAKALSEQTIAFRRENCECLTFSDGEFDAVTAAFGIRNFQNLDKGLSEMCRVTRSGGHVAILELSRPQGFPMKQLFWLYSHTLLPLQGRLVSKDNKAYGYLTNTIEAFPKPEIIVEALQRAGFTNIAFKRLTFGTCIFYHAQKP